MKSTAVFPSLLVFGPQTKLPSSDVLAELRQFLLENPRLADLRSAVESLPALWQALTEFDPSLNRVPGAQYLGDLKQWIVDGVFPHHRNGAPNVFALPVTILLQIILYVRYLSRLEVKDPHCHVLEGLKAGGIQGFCAGFLTAIAVACAENDDDIVAIGAVSLRLAVCIGAYIDQDGCFADPSNNTACLALRWRTGDFKEEEVARLVETYRHAYISSINDDACVTVTAQAADVAGMMEDFQARGMRAKTLHLQGRFHSAVHASAVEKIIKFSSSLDEMSFPTLERVQVPLRSNLNGEIITAGSLYKLALESVLLKPADWYRTIKAAILQLPESHKVVGFAGFGSHIPSSLLQISGLQILSLSNFEESNARRLGESIPVNGLTNGTSVNGTHHSTNGTLPKIQPQEPPYPPHSVAVVGMACRFPGADSLDEFWQLLLSGTSMVEPAPCERLKLPGPQIGDHPGTKWWGNFLNNSDAFDHRFFKKSSREALAWDPQQRILLEVVYEAMESSGYFGDTSTSAPNDYGCYIGAVMNNYYDNVSCHPPTAYATVGTSRCFLSGSMSHYFGWTGPALTIDTACSSSLVAVHAACRAIMSGECSRAIAGGTNVITSPFDYQNLRAAGFLSPTGQCKPFDVSADGYCRGEGVGVVVLKSLASAIEENDNILGVIVGSAANQNENCSHITVPHSGSQSSLYNRVMSLGGVTPESVSYVEAHGTGTGVGDPVECQSIRKAFGGPSRDQTLYFGSVKGNIGHTEATAGIAGLIKVLLMMQHGKIPAQVSFSTLNPKIPPLEADRMAIPRSVLDWTPSLRLACVNSYGAAGSNAAVMIRQKPNNTFKAVQTGQKAIKQLFKFPIFISAASANSLSMYCEKLLKYIKSLKSKDVTDNLLSALTFNLADRANHSLPHLFSTTVTDMPDLENKLAAAASGSETFKSEVAQNRMPVVLVFGGQESDFIGVSEELYQSSSLFRHHLDQCNKILKSLGFGSLYPAIFQNSPISNLVTLHSALFSVQYSSAKAWMDCGLEVNAVVGHSFGQLTALCISGSLSLKDALKLVAGRASIMLKYWGPERGSMIWLGTDSEKVFEIIDSLKAQGSQDELEIACYNGPKSHVVVGSAQSIEALEKFVTSDPSLRESVRTKRLRVTNGFHSKFTDPLLPHLTALAKELVWRSPMIHLETCDLGQSCDEPDFRLAAHHTRHPVYFDQAVKRLAQQYSQCTWLEAGHGSSVMQLVRGCLAANQNQEHIFLSPQLKTSNAESSLAEITLNLWKAGYAAQYWLFHRSHRQQYRFLTLPPYQFEKSRHWLPFSERADSAVSIDAVQEKPKHELLSFVKFKDDGKKEAIFRVDPQSNRFQSLLNGHVMAGQCLAPASLYFELVSRAAMSLHSDSAHESHVPVVESLHMKSPIGRDINKDIFLCLTRMESSRPSWSFAISTQARQNAKGHISEAFQHTTGVVYLEKRDDTQATLSFKRFEKLIGTRRCEEIMNNPEAEKMQGKHIYRAFNHIVHYGENFRGIRNVSSVRLETAGKVVMSVDPDAGPEQRLCETPMIDSFMQFAGFLVNYFNNPSLEDVLVCMKIERIEIGGSFNPEAKEWIVYATMTEDGDREAASDVYVFEVESKKLVMAAFGFHFSKVSQSLLARMLQGVNKSNDSGKAASKVNGQKSEKAVVEASESSTTSSSSRCAELFEVLHNVTDIPLEELKDESTLDDLGIDSLMATEVLNDIRAAFGVSIDLTEFLFFDNIRAIWTHLDSKLGNSPEAGASEVHTLSNGVDVSDQNGSHVDATSLNVKPPKTLHTPSKQADLSTQPSITSAYNAFDEIQYGYDQYAKETKAANFWTQVYPEQARLILAYVVEGFTALGCSMKSLRPGSLVPEVQCLAKHKKLTRQLYHILEDANLISVGKDGFLRTKVPVDTTPAETIFQELIELYPHHANVHRLTKVIGSRLAECLIGEEDGLQLVFGDKANKKNLEDVYENWPLLRTPTLLLGDFLTKAFSNSSGSGKFRILEVGAGTGGTTRYIVNHLRSHGIPFEYTFTDLSASLVAAAKKQFKGAEDMVFEVLDIEKSPVDEHLGAFHVIIATNCIHATRRLDQSLSHLRKMLREDGALTLVEITKNMFWLDIAVGLFEGWWLFEDGRSHALASETHWERCLRNSGFREVSWTDGKSPEAKTVRVIAGFPSANPESKSSPNDSKKTAAQASMETVIYKELGNTKIHADVYYPAASYSPSAKMPVALMIHGGSHMIFSRKDIRPPQTRLLLERGFLPVSIDHRLCPEVSLSEGPMLDVCDALEWARYKLPTIKLQRTGLQIDGERVVVVGWSSGGQLAMSLAWTAPQRGLRPPEAILAFYCPTNYEDEWWRSPIQPKGAEDTGDEYDLLEGIQDEPITSYGAVGAWAPLSDPRIRTDPRCRIVLHINWKAQTLPLIVGGLPSKKKLTESDTRKWYNLPQPAQEKIVRVSPLAQIVRGNYQTPTFLIHGTNDDLIPWQQSKKTYDALVEGGVVAGLELVQGAPHICDLSSDPESVGWKATLNGYDFINSFV